LCLQLRTEKKSRNKSSESEFSHRWLDCRLRLTSACFFRCGEVAVGAHMQGSAPHARQSSGHSRSQLLISDLLTHVSDSPLQAEAEPNPPQTSNLRQGTGTAVHRVHTFPPSSQCRSSSSLRLSPLRHSASRRRLSTCVAGRPPPSHPPLESSLAAPAWSGWTHRGPWLVLLCTAEVTCCAVRRPQVPDRSRPELPHAPGHAPQDGRARRVPRAVARDPRQGGLVRTEPLVGTLRPFLILLSNQDRAPSRRQCCPLSSPHVHGSAMGDTRSFLTA
jgi:hypothetical protein